MTVSERVAPAGKRQTRTGSDGGTAARKIWIDLDNSPHVPFFAPIIKELERRGYSVCLTARDAYQVYELADLFQLNCARIGRHYGKHRTFKVAGTCLRALQLLPHAAAQKPALAMSHGSRSQLLASTLLGIPSVGIFDYEFSRFLPVRPTWAMVPDVIPDTAIPVAQNRILRYPGIKEDVYAPGFKPDSSLRSRLGLDDCEIIVTLRPPANEAHYHNPKSDELFAAAMSFLSQSPNTKVILLPRNAAQAAAVRACWSEFFSDGRFIIPEHAVDGLNLIWNSDLVISGGGTMNREAAALGVPVYSIFRGKIGAVDTYLARNGRLVLLESADDIRAKIALHPRDRSPAPEHRESAALKRIVDHVAEILAGNPLKAAENHK